MLKLLKPKHRSILGIDISSSAVKILEISGSGEDICVEGYGREEIPTSALEGNMIKDVDVVANCIKKLVERLRFTCKKCGIGCA